MKNGAAAEQTANDADRVVLIVSNEAEALIIRSYLPGVEWLDVQTVDGKVAA